MGSLGTAFQPWVDRRRILRAAGCPSMLESVIPDLASESESACGSDSGCCWLSGSRSPIESSKRWADIIDVAQDYDSRHTKKAHASARELVVSSYRDFDFVVNKQSVQYCYRSCSMPSGISELTLDQSSLLLADQKLYWGTACLSTDGWTSKAPRCVMERHHTKSGK